MQEDWRPISGFSDYEVSSLGRVRSYRARTNTNIPRAKPYIMKGNYDIQGYYRVKLRDSSGKAFTKKVHILVCEAWHGNKPTNYGDHKSGVRHLDGDQKNNTQNNLIWGTPLENKADSISHATYIHGTKHHSNRLTEQQVLEIFESKKSNNDLSAEYGVTSGMISHIRTGRKWKHLTNIDRK